MVKKEIAYTDFEGNKRVEEFYFNLTKAEFFKWMMTTGEYTIDKVLIRLAEEKNGKKIIENFETILKASYGRKSLDGRKFEKSEEIWLDFYQTEAYSILFMDLISDAKKTAGFVNSLIPGDVTKDLEKALQENKDSLPVALRDYID